MPARATTLRSNELLEKRTVARWAEVTFSAPDWGACRLQEEEQELTEGWEDR
jgi:hypothetical protein